MRINARFVAVISLIGLAGCAGAVDAPELATDNAVTTQFIEPGSYGEALALAVVNDPTVDFTTLDEAGRLDRRAAANIIAHRNGADGQLGTADDDLFDDIGELDAISYVGPTALLRLVELAEALGYADNRGSGGEPTPAEKAIAILALVNSSNLTLPLLDDDVSLDSRAAANIFAVRTGADGTLGTADDQSFRDLVDLDAVPYVGERALGKLLDYAVAHGYLPAPRSSVLTDVVFSPQIYAASHNARIADLIDEAQSSIDIAMYSFSDADISDAIERAVQRGVQVRFVFETAHTDRNEANLAATKSGRLEAAGVNVRWVNKIMHHKFAIIDGPRDDAAKADTGTLVTGSGNWSWGAATLYDENTLFLRGHAELTLRMQRQFNLMWEHSHDFVYDATLPYDFSTFHITDADIQDDPAVDANFTSDNFSVSGDTFSIVTGRDTVADQLVAAIHRATDSIHIASGHMRSRKVAQALENKIAENPGMDIRVYLDSQEYVSASTYYQLVNERDDCLAQATTPSQERHCYDKGFYYGYELGLTNIQVRYKHYAYRWHYSYAVQMHHKYMIIDGVELWTGSYNLSDNAEHNTLENMLVFRGPGFAQIIQSYEQNFSDIWDTNRDGTYEDLLQTVETASVIPLVYSPMALTWDQVHTLKAAIAANCADLNSEPFRTAPEKHHTCQR